MFCDNCGNKLDDNAKFCMNCGKAVQASKPAVSAFAPASDLADDTFRPRTPARPAAPTPVYSAPVKPTVPTPVYSAPVKPTASSEAAAAQPKPVAAEPPRREAPVPARTAPVMAPVPPEKKKPMNWKLLVILLLIAAVVGVVVWGFADGWLPDLFSGSETGKGGDKDEDKEDEESNPHADWNDYQVGDLTLYLPDEFEEDHVDGNSAIFFSDDVEIEIGYGPAEDISDDIRSADDVAEAYIEMIEDWDSVIHESDTENGVPYVIYARDEDSDDIMVVGFYFHDDTAWVVCAENFDPDQAEDVIPYVTSGEVKKGSENRDEDDDRDDDRVSAETGPQLEQMETPGIFVECNGMSFRLYEYFEEYYNEDSYASYYNDVMNVDISSGDLDDIGDDIDNSRELAEYYAEGMDNVEFGKQNGITYITILEDEYVSGEALGFYAEGDTGWIIRVTASDFYSYEDEIIDMITSGELD